ncbi:MAG: beta strand repeat-containing protein, partial [Thiohalomonadales bacterium]
LTLIGGDIGLSGATLQAANGTIQIASVGGEAYVPAKLANYGSTVSDDLGTIGLSNGATIDTGGNAGGSIIIRGGKLMMDDSSISNKTNFMYNGEQDLSGIDIDIEGSISLDNAGQITTLNEGMGTAAPINIKAGAALNIANKSFISASAGNFNSEGRGGDIDISAETVTITGVIGAPPPNPDAFEVVTITGIHSDGALFGDSPSGNISVDANNITVENNGGIFANSSGSITGGDINLDANGGSINITDGGRIEIVSILEGAGGNINLHAKTINLSGGAFALNNRSSYQQSRIVINTTISSSAAGNVNIESEQFSLTDGAIISTVTQQGQGGGNVTINSDLVYLSDFNTSGMASSDNTTYNSQEAVDGKTGFASKISTFQSFSEISGNESGGNITLNSNKITISEYATLETVTEGISDNNTITLIGGNIALRADDITIQQNSKLSTAQLDNDGSNTARGNGNISITANDSLIIDTSTIETKIYSSIGSGGDISINANKLLLKNSVFDTSANNGDGGNISIKSAQAIITPDNIFNTNSANEINGVIDIEIYKLDDKTAITTPPHNTEQVLLNTSPCDIEKHLGNSSLFVGHRTKTSMIYPSTTILAESSTQLRHQPFEVLAANTSSCSRKFNGRM